MLALTEPGSTWPQSVRRTKASLPSPASSRSRTVALSSPRRFARAARRRRVRRRGGRPRRAARRGSRDTAGSCRRDDELLVLSLLRPATTPSSSGSGSRTTSRIMHTTTRQRRLRLAVRQLARADAAAQRMARRRLHVLCRMSSVALAARAARKGESSTRPTGTRSNGCARALPDLMPARPACLTHGDFWKQNILATDDGSPAVIDPAVSYMWADVDVAHLWSTPHPPQAESSSPCTAS